VVKSTLQHLDQMTTTRDAEYLEYLECAKDAEARANEAEARANEAEARAKEAEARLEKAEARAKEAEAWADLR
jgi:predicted S18 family serine protease